MKEYFGCDVSPNGINRTASHYQFSFIAEFATQGFGMDMYPRWEEERGARSGRRKEPSPAPHPLWPLRHSDQATKHCAFHSSVNTNRAAYRAH